MRRQIQKRLINHTLEEPREDAVSRRAPLPLFSLSKAHQKFLLRVVSFPLLWLPRLRGLAVPGPGAAGLLVLGSGGLLQGVDHLLQDVGAVVGDLLQDGVGELLQLRALPLALLQLLLQLQGHTGTLSALP